MTVIGPSSEIAGRYLLLQKIAGGGMGEVWQGVDEVLGRPVAVKLLRSDLAGDPTFRERFRNEARSTAGVAHPGIAWVFDYGEEQLAGGGQVSYLVMELVEGEPLSAMLQRKGRLSPAQTLDVIAQAAAALQAAHDRGLVHRDVKPANLLVRPDGVLKITDFGIARAADSVPLTDTGTVMGSAPYLSPEQAQGLAATPASDVYSLGVVAYQCLVGQTPFTGAPATVAAAHVSQAVPAFPPDVPQPVQQLVDQMLHKDPERRPHPAGALGAEAAALAARLGFEAGALASAVTAPLSTRAVPRVERPAPAAPTTTQPAAGSPTAALGAASVAGPMAPTGATGGVAVVRRSRPMGLIVASVVVALAGLALLLALVLVHPTRRRAPASPSPTTPPTSTTTTTTPTSTTTSTPSTTTTSTSTTTTTSTSTTTTTSTSTTTTTTPTSTTTTAPTSTTTTVSPTPSTTAATPSARGATAAPPPPGR